MLGAASQGTGCRPLRTLGDVEVVESILSCSLRPAELNGATLVALRRFVGTLCRAGNGVKLASRPEVVSAMSETS